MNRKQSSTPAWIIVAIVAGGMALLTAGVIIVGAVLYMSSVKHQPVNVTTTGPEQPIVVASNKPAIPTQWTKICEEYKNNMVAADAKYKGNRVVFECGANGTVQKINNKPCVGYCNVANIRGSQPESNFCLFFKDTSEIAKFDGKSSFRVEGTVAGRVDDGINRLIRGYEFRVEVVDCVVLSKIQQ